MLLVLPPRAIAPRAVLDPGPTSSTNSIEEVDEAALWLEVLVESETVPEKAAKALWQEADELTRILVRSRETARKPR